MAQTALQPVKADALPWNGKELDIIKQVVAPGLTDLELVMFAKVCQHTRLNPILKQIYAIKRGDKSGNKRLTIQTSIDGYRLIASRTGQLAGIDKAIYYFDEQGKLQEAEVTVYRIVHGQRCAFTASAFWDEYKPSAGQDHMWLKMPRRMLAKCAESLALRMAFPAELSGIYTDAEMEQADSEQTLGAQVLAQATIQEEKPLDPVKTADIVLAARAVDLKNRAALVGWIGSAYSKMVCEATGKTAKQLQDQGKPTGADLDKLERRIILLEKAAKAEAEKADGASAANVVESEPEPEVA